VTLDLIKTKSSTLDAPIDSVGGLLIAKETEGGGALLSCDVDRCFTKGLLRYNEGLCWRTVGRPDQDLD